MPVLPSLLAIVAAASSPPPAIFWHSEGSGANTTVLALGGGLDGRVQATRRLHHLLVQAVGCLVEVHLFGTDAQLRAEPEELCQPLPREEVREGVAVPIEVSHPRVRGERSPLWGVEEDLERLYHQRALGGLGRESLGGTEGVSAEGDGGFGFGRLARENEVGEEDEGVEADAQQLQHRDRERLALGVFKGQVVTGLGPRAWRLDWVLRLGSGRSYPLGRPLDRCESGWAASRG